ncbi:MAG: hypothetical protein GEU90_10580 [Gemmatimonas sp.]|nr:hypothetical protein [Gemmatimonas sp.]
MRRCRHSAIFSLAAFLVGGVLMGSGTPATLHLALSRAEPAVDGTVTSAPESINLFFTQAPQKGATAIRLVGAGDQEVALDEGKQDADDGKIVRASVTGTVAPGSYSVVWRTMATDGHVVRGDFEFAYRPDSSEGPVGR